MFNLVTETWRKQVLSPSNIITLFERQAISFDALCLSANDPLLDILERLNNNAENELIRLERKGLRATQFVGVIQADRHVIQILPKIDCDPGGAPDATAGSPSHNKAAISAAHNFIHLLSYARQLKLHSQALASLHTGSGVWLDMLTHLFAVELMTQLQLGFHHDYVRQEDMLPYVRGRWHIARQFSRQPNLAQGLDVSYDDYSPDTPLNRVFRYAINRLQLISRDPQTRHMLADLDSWLLSVQLPGQIRVGDLKRIEFNRLNERFQPAFELAQLFLEEQTIEILAGEQRAYAFVFNMDQLFEQFVANLLQSQARRILPEAWANCQFELQGGKPGKYLVQPPHPSEQPLFHLKPDILLKLLGTTQLIIDTKNKVLPFVRPYRSVAEADVYQMLAYANQFQCSNVLLLYPHSFGAAQDNSYCLSIQGTTIRLFIATLDLHQPLEHIDRLIYDLRNILEDIHLEVNRMEVVWPA